MKLKLKIANGTIIYADNSNATIIFADDGRAWIRTTNANSTELDPTLFTQQRYEGLLLWVAINGRPELVDFTHPEKVIWDGKNEILHKEEIAANEFQAQLTGAGFSVKPPA